MQIGDSSIVPPRGNRIVENTPISQDEQHKPEDKQQDLYFGYVIATIGTIVALTTFPPLALLGLSAMAGLLKHVEDIAYSRKRAATLRMAEAIANEFKERVEIVPQVPIEVKKDLDLFIRFPDAKINFAFLVRATGEGVAFYRERDEKICFKRPGKSGTTRYDSPDLIALGKEQEAWLRKNRRDLFGGTSRDVRRPLFRAIVFATPSRLREHPEHLRATIIGNQEFVQIKNSRGVIYLLQEDQVIKFLKAYLAQNASE